MICNCGEPAHNNPEHEGGCQHAQDTTCHRNALLGCPQHFAELSADALETAVHQAAHPFMNVLRHLNADGYTYPMYFTWMALLGRYAVEGEGDREALLARYPTVMPDMSDGPDYAPAVLNRLNFASRAALVNDGATVAAILESVEDMSARATISLLISVAASTNLAVEHNDSCTGADVQVFHMLGSQVTNEHGFMSLPLLVDLVMGQWKGDAPRAVRAWKALMELSEAHPETMPVVMDVVGRAVGQMLAPDAVLVTTGGHRLGEGFVPTGMVDVETARPEDVAPEVMAGVWAARAAQVYAGATDRPAANAQIRAMAEGHPRGLFGFAVDVALAGTSMLGYAMDEQEHRNAAG